MKMGFNSTPVMSVDPEEMSRQDVAAAADADHRGFVDAGKTVGQIDQIVLQEAIRV